MIWIKHHTDIKKIRHLYISYQDPGSHLWINVVTNWTYFCDYKITVSCYKLVLCTNVYMNISVFFMNAWSSIHIKNPSYNCTEVDHYAMLIASPMKNEWYFLCAWIFTSTCKICKYSIHMYCNYKCFQNAVKMLTYIFLGQNVRILVIKS